MRISDNVAEELLLSSGKFTPDKISVLKSQEKDDKKSLQELALSSGLISERKLTELYADKVEVPFTDISVKNIPRETLHLIPERIAKQYSAVVFGIDDDGHKLLAIDDPDDIQAISFLQKQLGTDLKIYVATKSNILQAIDQYRENISSEITQVISGEQEEQDKEDLISENEIAEDSPIAQTVNLLVEGAIKAGASDIHIEPRENFVSVRYRVDGILKEVNKLPKNVQNALVSRIKILSNLKIDERRVPQDGRFKIMIGGRKFALRVSTLPVTDGEKVVMRILSEGSKALTLEELGYWGYSLKVVNQAIAQPHGMVLVTGPTGSGKSTSLFSVLSILNSPDVNISTIEDPVEYKIIGANQTQVNPVAGMTFAAGLRALLRQDPNIIMVGEIRDHETASLAVQAALTGHLVFATLHTNNAATCLPRLLDMGIEPFLIASTVRAVIGQRLVRKLCPNCRSSYIPSQEVLTKINNIFDISNASKMKRIHDLEKEALDEGIGLPTIQKVDKPKKEDTQESTGGLSTTDTKITRLWKAKIDGCDECGNNGYRGRMGIYEVLGNDHEIQNLIVSNATSDVIEAQAMKDGMITMQMDGFIKALRGMTTLEEILRVTAED